MVWDGTIWISNSNAHAFRELEPLEVVISMLLCSSQWTWCADVPLLICSAALMLCDCDRLWYFDALPVRMRPSVWWGCSPSAASRCMRSNHGQLSFIDAAHFCFIWSSGPLCLCGFYSTSLFSHIFFVHSSLASPTSFNKIPNILNLLAPAIQKQTIAL